MLFRKIESKIARVFVVYGDEHLESGIDRLDRFSEQVFPNDPQATIIVDNRGGADHEVSSHAKYNVIVGENSNREFSGWDKGIEALAKGTDLIDTSTVLLANDTFHRNYGEDYLSQFKRRDTKSRVRKGQIVGYVDSYPREIQLFDLCLRSWVRTSIVICSWKALQGLLPLSIPIPDSEIFSEDPHEFFLPNAPLSANYQDYIKTWLFQAHAPDAEFHSSWHSKTKIDENNFSALKAKARSILAEHFLSARAKRLGIAVYAVNAKRTQDLGLGI